MDPNLEQTPLFVLCQCGCGRRLPPTNKLGQPSRFAHGHNRRKPDTPTEKRRVRKAGPPCIPDQPLSVPCACGCGTMLPAINQLGRPSQWAKGHHNRGRRLSEEQRRALSERQKRLYDLKGRKEPTWRRHSDPRYREWRLAVFERDAYTCQACGYVGQANEKGFAAHHVKEWAKFPALRYDVPNGLTLCRPCHMSLHGLAVKPRTMRLCGCGCGTLIRTPGRDGKERRYVNHHQSRGRVWTPEQRRALSAAKTGKPMPEGFGAKQSAARKGKRPPPQVQEAARKARTGTKDPATAERNRTRVWTDEMRAKLSASRKGQRPSDEARAKMSASRKGKPKSPETRARMAESARQRHAREKARCDKT